MATIGNDKKNDETGFLRFVPLALPSVIIINSIEMYKILSLILFGCLTSLASMSLHFLTEEIGIWYSNIHGVSKYRVNRWQKIYFTILDFIMEIDGFFGPMQVIIISHILIRIIMDISISAKILFGQKKRNPIVFFIRNLGNIFTIIGFVFGNEIIKRKVLDYLTISYRIFNN